MLAVDCLIYFFAHYPQHASLLCFKYARKKGLCFPRVVCRVVRMVMSVLHLGRSLFHPPTRLFTCLPYPPTYPTYPNKQALPSAVSTSSCTWPKPPGGVSSPSPTSSPSWSPSPSFF